MTSASTINAKKVHLLAASSRHPRDRRDGDPEVVDCLVHLPATHPLLPT